MGYRLPYVKPDPTPKAKPKKEGAYLDFIRELPCCVTGRHGVEAAHLSYAMPKYGHYGRARGSKASDRWCLPLCPEEHRAQHDGSEQAYWLAVGYEPHVLALTLYGLWSEHGRDAHQYAEAVVYSYAYRRRS